MICRTCSKPFETYTLRLRVDGVLRELKDDLEWLHGLCIRCAEIAFGAKRADAQGAMAKINATLEAAATGADEAVDQTETDVDVAGLRAALALAGEEVLTGCDHAFQVARRRALSDRWVVLGWKCGKCTMELPNPHAERQIQAAEAPDEIPSRPMVQRPDEAAVDILRRDIDAVLGGANARNDAESGEGGMAYEAGGQEIPDLPPGLRTLALLSADIGDIITGGLEQGEDPEKIRAVVLSRLTRTAQEIAGQKPEAPPPVDQVTLPAVEVTPEDFGAQAMREAAIRTQVWETILATLDAQAALRVRDLERNVRLMAAPPRQRQEALLAVASAFVLEIMLTHEMDRLHHGGATEEEVEEVAGRRDTHRRERERLTELWGG